MFGPGVDSALGAYVKDIDSDRMMTFGHAVHLATHKVVAERVTRIPACRAGGSTPPETKKGIPSQNLRQMLKTRSDISVRFVRFGTTLSHAKALCRGGVHGPEHVRRSKAADGAHYLSLVEISV